MVFPRNQTRQSTADSVDPWKDLKDEIGFGSYNEYLEAYREQESVIRFLKTLTSSMKSTEQPLCSVVDISRDHDSSATISSQDYGSNQGNATKLLGDLRHPPQTSMCRILLWWLRPKYAYPTWLLDVCGLGLRIGPQFFDALHARASVYSRASESALPMWSFPLNHTLVGQHISTTARDYLPGQAASPPIVLVVGWDSKFWDSMNDVFQPTVYFPGVCERQDVDIHNTPPFHNPHESDKNEDRDARLQPKSIYYGTRAYKKVLHWLLEQKRGIAMRDDEYPTFCTMPLIRLDIISLQIKSSLFWRFNLSGVSVSSDDENGEQPRDVHSWVRDERYWFRRHIGDSESSQRHFADYISSKKGYKWIEDEVYLELRQQWDDALSDARGIEAEARDLMQLEAGYLSLEESRKSIELSNHQLEENKRCKSPQTLESVMLAYMDIVKICK